jgi:hypothetical protein
MLNRVAQRRPEAGQAGEIEAFLQRWLDETAEFVGTEDPNEDAYLHKLCAELAQFDPVAFPERSKITFEDEHFKSGPVFGKMPFIVLQFDLAPGAVITPHNHVGWSFLSLGVKGDALVRHFEPHGEAPEPGKDLETRFKVREVSSRLLTKGTTSPLTRTRGNIHGFQAGEEGARFIDFGIHFPDPGQGYRSFSKMEYDPKPLDRDRRIYEARWIGNPKSM